MKLSKEFRTWFAQRGALIIFTVIVMFLVALKIWSDQRPEPLRFTRTFASSTQNVEVLWLNQNFYTKIIVDSSGEIYAMLSGDSLIAINSKSGSMLWQVPLPLERGGGARGLLTSQNTVFVITSIEIDAYKATTGELKWATNLGYGHVSIFSQIDSGVVRIYYGDKIFEIDPETGKILTSKPRADVIWVSGNIELRAVSNKQYSVSGKQLSAFDKQTGDALWTKPQPFYIDEVQTPQSINANTLILGREPAGTSDYIRGICALDLQSGENNWCRPETYHSNMAIDQQFQRGYAMRDNSVLVVIDLKTGNILGETKFLPNEPVGIGPISFNNGVVVVSFFNGYDGGQTFGLKFNQ